MDKDYTKLVVEFEALTMSVEDFSHRDHVGIAFEILSKYPFLQATNVYSETIKTLATRAGATTKFNLTITLAFLSLISERVANTSHENANAFIDANDDLLKSNPLGRLYSKERLSSDRAKTHFLLPDLVA